MVTMLHCHRWNIGSIYKRVANHFVFFLFTFLLCFCFGVFCFYSSIRKKKAFLNFGSELNWCQNKTDNDFSSSHFSSFIHSNSFSLTKKLFSCLTTNPPPSPPPYITTPLPLHFFVHRASRQIKERTCWILFFYHFISRIYLLLKCFRIET